jgi:hypothetical protein
MVGHSGSWPFRIASSKPRYQPYAGRAVYAVGRDGSRLALGKFPFLEVPPSEKFRTVQAQRSRLVEQPCPNVGVGAAASQREPLSLALIDPCFHRRQKVLIEDLLKRPLGGNGKQITPRFRIVLLPDS